MSLTGREEQAASPFLCLRVKRDIVKLIFEEWFLPVVFPEQNLFASKQMRKIQLAHIDHPIH